MFLNNPEDITSVLTKIQLQKIPLTVKIAGAEQVFNSSLYEINSEEHSPSLLIESLSPHYGNELIRHCNSFTIDSALPKDFQKHESMSFNFNAFFLSEETYQGRPALRISYPEKRLYYRAEPDSKQPINATLELESKQIPHRVNNISTGGLGFYTNLEISTGTELKLSFMLPFGAQIETGATVRWFVHLGSEKIIDGVAYGCFCGLEFEGIDIIMQQQLAKYIGSRKEEELQEFAKKVDELELLPNHMKKFFIP